MVTAAVLSRRFERIHKTLYHGTSSKQYHSLMNGVNISKSSAYTDFGQGFYLTSDFHQASKHAEKRSFKSSPVVFVFDVNMEELKQFNSKIWLTMDREWAGFIYQNRSPKIKVTHHYDYVFGGVADGQLDDLIALMDDDIIGVDAFYENIAKYATYDQLSVHNQMIFDYNIIKLVKVVNAYEKGNEFVDPAAG